MKMIFKNDEGGTDLLPLKRFAYKLSVYPQGGSFYNGRVLSFKVSVLKYLKYFSGISLLLLLTACNTPETPAPDYQGNWKNTLENPKLENILVISKMVKTISLPIPLKTKKAAKPTRKIRCQLQSLTMVCFRLIQVQVSLISQLTKNWQSGRFRLRL